MTWRPNDWPRRYEPGQGWTVDWDIALMREAQRRRVERNRTLLAALACVAVCAVLALVAWGTR